MTAPEIEFVPLALKHLDLLHVWLQQPHVREYWDDGHRTREQVQAHYLDLHRDVPAFVVGLGGRPTGYLQTYRVSADSEYGQWRSPHGDTVLLRFQGIQEQHPNPLPPPQHRTC